MYQNQNFEETSLSLKRKHVDQYSPNNLNTKRQHLCFSLPSDSKNFEASLDGIKDESYDVLCEYLNILIPPLKWHTNTAQIPTRYEVVDLTQRQAKSIANQLSLILKQAIVSIEKIQEQNYRVLLSGVNIKYLQEMSISLHKNRIWIPENIPVEDLKKILGPGSMFGYPSLTAYLKVLINLGMNKSLSMEKIKSEWNLLKSECDAEEKIRNLRKTIAYSVPEAKIVIKDIIKAAKLEGDHTILKMAILNDREKKKKIKDCLLKYTCQGNYWLFHWYFRANNYRIDKNLLLCAAASNNIEIVRDLIGYGVNWNVRGKGSILKKGEIELAGIDLCEFEFLAPTPVLIASKQDMDIFKLLLTSRADVNFLTSGAPCDDFLALPNIFCYKTWRFLIASSQPCLSFSVPVRWSNSSPSLLEIFLGYPERGDKREIAKLLISNGAISTQLNTGFNWLDFAILAHSLDLMECMVNHFPLIVLQKSSSGNTPLHNAVVRGYSPLVKYLIDHAPQCLLWKDSSGEMPIDSFASDFNNIFTELKSNDYRIFQLIDYLLKSDYKKEEKRIAKILELTPQPIYLNVKKQNIPISIWDRSTIAYKKYADYMKLKDEKPESIIPFILPDTDNFSDDVLLQYLLILMPTLPWERKGLGPVYKIGNLKKEESNQLAYDLKIAFLGYPVHISIEKQFENIYQVEVEGLSTALVQLAARQLLEYPIPFKREGGFMEEILSKDLILNIMLPYLDIFDFASEKELKIMLLGFGMPIHQLNKYIESQWQELEEPSPEKIADSTRKRLINALKEINSAEDKEAIFYKAIKTDDFWLYKLLIYKGYVSIDEWNERRLPLVFHAVSLERSNILEDLIISGADIRSFFPPDPQEPNQEPENVFFSDTGDSESTPIDPLTQCVEAKNHAALALLVAGGANVNNLDAGGTILHLAVQLGNLDLVKFLVESGAALHYNPSWFGVPLNRAVSNADYPMARYLISQGADIHKIRRGAKTQFYLSLQSLELPSIGFFIYLLDVLKLSLTKSDYHSEILCDLLLRRNKKGETLLYQWANKVEEIPLLAYLFIRLAYSPFFEEIFSSCSDALKKNLIFSSYFSKNVTQSILEVRLSNHNLFRLPVSSRSLNPGIPRNTIGFK